MYSRLLLCSALFMIAAPAVASPKPFTKDEARAIVGTLQKVVSPHGIDKQMQVPINGTKQWITIRGRDLDNPILLFIHGGPGAPEMPTSWTFQNPWEDYFTVVQWDQRGSGKTYNANDPKQIAPTVTEAQMVSDAEAMVAYLRVTYHKPKDLRSGTFLGLDPRPQARGKSPGMALRLYRHGADDRHPCERGARLSPHARGG